MCIHFAEKRLVHDGIEQRGSRANLDRHQSLGSARKAREDELPRQQLVQSGAPQGLDMNEYIGRALASGEEAKPA
jgi:hypothetical protein